MRQLAQFTGTMKCAIFISLAVLVLTSSAQTTNFCINRCLSEYSTRNKDVTDPYIFCSSYLTHKNCSLNCNMIATDREQVVKSFQLMDQVGFNCQSGCYSSTCMSNYLQGLKLSGVSFSDRCRAFTSFETCMKNACSSNLNNAFQQVKLQLGCNSCVRVQFSLVAIITCIFLALKI